MTKRQHEAWTKDEKFLIATYEMAKEAGELDAPFNRYDIGRKINLHPRGVDTICTLLLQANFLKKGEDKDVYLTPNGIRLVESLLE